MGEKEKGNWSRGRELIFWEGQKNRGKTELGAEKRRHPCYV
jgi:hypothetical protein